MAKLTKKQEAVTRGQYHILIDDKEYLIDWYVSDAYSKDYTPRLHLDCPHLSLGMGEDYRGALPVPQEYVEAKARPFADAFSK
jgi:hypothetical protein